MHNSGKSEYYSLDNLSVLLVDDNRNMLQLVSEILDSFEVKNVRAVTSVAEAFEELKKFDADLVITDWEMAPVSGIEFIRQLRTSEDSSNSTVPILMLTGYTELHCIIEARDAGVTEFLAKPVSAKSVYDRIISLIEHPRPFIRAKDYVGPDRRRKVRPHAGVERRKNAQAGGREAAE